MVMRRNERDAMDGRLWELSNDLVRGAMKRVINQMLLSAENDLRINVRNSVRDAVLMPSIRRMRLKALKNP